MLEIWLVYPDVHCLLYCSAVILWIHVQDFDNVHGEMVLRCSLQVEVLGNLRGGITRHLCSAALALRVLPVSHKYVLLHFLPSLPNQHLMYNPTDLLLL